MTMSNKYWVVKLTSILSNSSKKIRLLQLLKMKLKEYNSPTVKEFINAQAFQLRISSHTQTFSQSTIKHVKMGGEEPL